MRQRFLLPISMLLFGACADDPAVSSSQSPLKEGTDGSHVYPDTDPDVPNDQTVCKTITVSGHVYYNDLRSDGRFSLRYTPPIGAGPFAPLMFGTRRPWSDSVGALNKNYLGLLDGTVEIYETDFLAGSAFPKCKKTSKAGETTINSAGYWTWTGQVCDACRDDAEGSDDNGISIAAKIVLENCANPNTRCFSVNKSNGVPTADHFGQTWTTPAYSRWHRGATDSAPVEIHQGTTIDIGTDYFQRSATATAGDISDLDAQAASVFASAVDVTRKLHVDNNVAFEPGGGSVAFYFPDVTGWSHSHQDESNKVCIMAPGRTHDTTLPTDQPTAWFDGGSAAHEYGHLVNFWQWDGNGKWVSYAYDSDGDGHIDTLDDHNRDADGDGDGIDEAAESGSTREYTITALKEGWASFIRDYTFDGTGSPDACDRVERSAPVECVGPATCAIGRHYFGDVTESLCDMVDGTNNTEANDTVSVTIRTMINALGEVWSSQPSNAILVANATSSSPTTAPFGVCDIARQLVNRGSTTTSAMRNALAQTLLDCGL